MLRPLLIIYICGIITIGGAGLSDRWRRCAVHPPSEVSLISLRSLSWPIWVAGLWITWYRGDPAPELELTPCAASASS